NGDVQQQWRRKRGRAESWIKRRAEGAGGRGKEGGGRREGERWGVGRGRGRESGTVCGGREGDRRTQRRTQRQTERDGESGERGWGWEVRCGAKLHQSSLT
ncbi:hypothetical protein M758_6G208800, partial [Ceratodon purpureus]